MRILQIATVGEDTEPIMVGIRELPISRLILLHTRELAGQVDQLLNTLNPLKLDITTREVEGDPLLGVIKVVTEIIAEDSIAFDDVFINVSSGSKMISCAALSAAFVNGAKAIAVKDNGIMQLPVLKFSYTELISEPKMRILGSLARVGGAVDSLNALAKACGVEKSLLSYHVRGGRDSKGLEDLGLIHIDRARQGRLVITLTPLGQLMLAGRDY